MALIVSQDTPSADITKMTLELVFLMLLAGSLTLAIAFLRRSGFLLRFQFLFGFAASHVAKSIIMQWGTCAQRKE
jgi:hypothetical protein